ncbi:MAG: T9SS type A sorting domain-containing protein [Ignavibacteriae bacterium]|nr:T9SS type A sorting domain-containing protein [Ignavibacteriota bacterium]MCB9208102.1 T9SS type A sorting domain-containing protein [Ignavibacteriales bacterium]MCB9258868.1 T9SS type A sorting domain-containing protein [Ignavibacteriales bacterium]
MNISLKYFLIISLFAISFSPLFASQYYYHSSMSNYRIQRTTFSYGGSPAYEPTAYSYGYSEHYYNGNPPSIPAWTEYKEVIRFYEFNLNFLPADAYNVSVKIEAYRSEGSGSSKFVKTSDNLYPNDEAMFDAVLNGSELFTVDNSSGTWHNITSSVTTNIAARGNVNFGVRRSGTDWGYVTVHILVEWDAPSHITAQNNFSGGTIKVGVNTSPILRTNPYNFSVNVNSTVNLQAVEQTNVGYSMIWNDTEAPLNKSEWRKYKDQIWSFKNSNQSYSFTAATDDNDSKYEAGLRKVCNISFKNNFIGISSSGNMKVNGTTYSAPTSSFNVVEQNKITAEATQYYEINAISYAFQNWEGEGTSRLKDFYPSLHKQYVANYKGTPLFSDANYRNLTFNTFNPRVTQNVLLNWSEHPNTSVTKYQIWRHEKYNGVYTSPVLLATVNRGTTTWTDNGFYIGNSYSDYQLFYDVRAYYSTENTYSVDSYKQCYGTSTAVNKIAETDSIATIEELLENSISNYPNPYNPATTISYQIKEAGNVQITVYDALGRKVKELVNEIRNPGKYEVMFDGSRLSSGIYFYTMKINNFTSSKKMLLTK